MVSYRLGLLPSRTDGQRFTMATTDWEVGCEVVFKSVNDEEISGEVFAFDKTARIVVLKQPGSAPRSSKIRIVSEKHLASVVMGKRPAQPPDMSLPHINMQACREREEKALKAAEADAARIGMGVSKVAQQMFDALAKTMPCKWDQKDIVVLEEVRVVEPYNSTSCSTKQPDDTATLDRVRKVLDMERKQLGIDA